MDQETQSQKMGYKDFIWFLLSEEDKTSLKRCGERERERGVRRERERGRERGERKRERERELIVGSFGVQY